MTCDVDSSTLSVTANEIWAQQEGKEMAFSHTAVVAFKGNDAYHGTVKCRENEVNKKDILDHLERIPPEDIYPEYQTQLTLASACRLITWRVRHSRQRSRQIKVLDRSFRTSYKDEDELIFLDWSSCLYCRPRVITIHADL